MEHITTNTIVQGSNTLTGCSVADPLNFSSTFSTNTITMAIQGDLTFPGAWTDTYGISADDSPILPCNRSMIRSIAHFATDLLYASGRVKLLRGCPDIPLQS